MSNPNYAYRKIAPKDRQRAYEVFLVDGGKYLGQVKKLGKAWEGRMDAISQFDTAGATRDAVADALLARRQGKLTLTVRKAHS